MRYKLIIIGFLISFSGFSQTIDQLELRLSHTSISDIDSIRRICDQIFKIDKYNESAIYFLMESYRYQCDDSPVLLFFSGGEKSNIDTTINCTDSINIFFENMIEADKLNPQPLILEAKYKFGRTISADSSKIKPLERALQLDNYNVEANYLLGQSYYFIFNKEFNNNPKHPDLEDLARNSFNKLLKFRR